MNNSDSTPPPAAAERASTLRNGRRVFAALAGGALALLCVGAYFFFAALPARLPEITPARFDAARQLWNKSGPSSYSLGVRVSGPQSAEYRVEIHKGEVVSATRNGFPLPAGRNRGIWSVPGMFSTIEFDLEHAEPRPAEPGVPVMHVLPLGTFDPQYGYPSRYRRVEWGSSMEASWEVFHFEPLE